jgi:hypothetical protein
MAAKLEPHAHQIGRFDSQLPRDLLNLAFLGNGDPTLDS